MSFLEMSSQSPASVLQKLSQDKYMAEDKVVARLLGDNGLDTHALEAIEMRAVDLVTRFRNRDGKPSMLDAFLQEYGLSNKEGIALMCLAEALLRVPDKATRDDLIADKIAPGDWAKHLGKADTLLVNASTWGLMLTGRVTSLGEDWSNKPANFIGRLTNKLGEPVIRQAVGNAMKILGGEFVLGQTINEAVKRGGKLFGEAQIYSFDMLGEGARTFADAERHFQSYKNAIARTGEMDETGSVFTKSGVSVKLSAIYPRYEFSKREAVIAYLGDKLLELARGAANANVKLTVDAEESDRLELSLEVFEYVARALNTPSWSGFGLAIQAYGRRARHVIAWIATLGKELGCKFMVRLVKGAYWDSEIKHCQELGLPDFTVLTRKSTTDLSYLVCAQDMLAQRDVLFCQFATHNAHSIAAIMHLGKDMMDAFEFQRLHGMGEAIYSVAQAYYQDAEIDKDTAFPPVRVYAPVGGHKDLLAYLVRRLLENGANSSFVNRFMDADIAPQDVVRDPVKVTRELSEIAHPKIRRPQDLFGQERLNSKGLDLTSAIETARLDAEIKKTYAQKFKATSLLGELPLSSGQTLDVTNPASLDDIVGHVQYAHKDDIDAAFQAAQTAQTAWDKLGGSKRADILNKAADMLEAQTLRLMAIVIREAGKTQDDAIAEVREAVDFCRYYASRAREDFTTPAILPGPSGEANSTLLCGRGVFVCISPWNFPLAIFTGQTVAALAAGNAVLTKPAEQTSIIAYETVKILHEAGVPKDVLMLVLGDGDIGAALTEHLMVSGVAFTGSTQTAKRINLTLAQKSGPIVPLIAETGGQNVMFVDSTALLEQVTDDVIQSAFKSAGQRCSALRVLYLQDDIADMAISMIDGAMEALRLGDPQKLETDIGPIIDERALAALEQHVINMKATGRPYYTINDLSDMQSELCHGTFVTPHMFEIDNINELEQEHFGPILHIIRYKAADLDAIFESAFSTGYGLTFGIHTRLDYRWAEMFAKAPVGNTYVNRNITGAVVGSQPFGGQGLSGTGFKAGGPRYLYKFASEKTLSVNIMASGGNTELLTLD